MITIRATVPNGFDAAPPPLRKTTAARRALDIIVALAALTLLAPLLLLISAAIVLETGRPIFFAQRRLGQCGRHFRLHKFRKFWTGPGAGGPLTLRDDPRMTRVGNFLMKTKLDELPQLWNVLKGEMSLVGPRPETPDLIEFSDRDYVDPSYAAVLESRPGLFGPCQFYFRDESAFYDGVADPARFYREVLFPMKTTIDLAYYQRRSLVSDLGWILRGVMVVLGFIRPRLPAAPLSEAKADHRHDGAYGEGPP